MATTKGSPEKIRFLDATLVLAASMKIGRRIQKQWKTEAKRGGGTREKTSLKRIRQLFPSKDANNRIASPILFRSRKKFDSVTKSKSRQHLGKTRQQVGQRYTDRTWIVITKNVDECPAALTIFKAVAFHFSFRNLFLDTYSSSVVEI